MLLLLWCVLWFTNTRAHAEMDKELLRKLDEGKRDEALEVKQRQVRDGFCGPPVEFDNIECLKRGAFGRC